MERCLTTAEMRGARLPAEMEQLPAAELSQLLVQAHIAGSDPRGCDVRVDSGEMINPKVWPRRPVDPARWRWKQGWKTAWRQDDSITILEALAAHLALLWRLGYKKELRKRFLHFIDNQATIGALAKGRSSSRNLHRIFRKSYALLLASGTRRALQYIETDLNVADEGSREFT